MGGVGPFEANIYGYVSSKFELWLPGWYLFPILEVMYIKGLGS